MLRGTCSIIFYLYTSGHILNFCTPKFLFCTTEYWYFTGLWWWLTGIMHKSMKCNAKNISVDECELNWLIVFTLRWTRIRDKPRNVYLLRIYLKSKVSFFSTSEATHPSKYLNFRYKNIIFITWNFIILTYMFWGVQWHK